MNSIVFNIVLILLLILANGVFALAEAAVVASRKARLQQRAQAGDTRAKAALELVKSPNNFLATVQIGITLIGIFSGAFGGATLSAKIADGLSKIPPIAPYADSLSLGLVVALITYLSLIVGELVPKRIGLHAPERIASLVATPMQILSKIAPPLVWFLSASSTAVLRILGMDKSEETPVSQEEINVMIEQGRRAGIFAAAEQDIVERVFSLGDRSVTSLMTRRPDVLWLDVNDDWEINRQKLQDSTHSRVPVCQDSLDEVLGIVKAKDLLHQCLEAETPSLTAVTQSPVLVPETLSAFKLLETFKKNHTHIMLVVDEYAVVQGVVTLNDVLTAVVGDLPAVQETEKLATQRSDGSWLLDGMLPIDEFTNIFSIDTEKHNSGKYQTLSGLIMTHLERIPKTGETFELNDLLFEIVDMDRHRIDKVLVKKTS